MKFYFEKNALNLYKIFKKNNIDKYIYIYQKKNIYIYIYTFIM
jgi:hypothetical protein